MSLAELEKIVGHNFKSNEILAHALVHSSYTNENKMGPLSNNERLEFLGDAVLELATSEYIFTNFPEMTEGEMTKLRASVVCEATLSKCARTLGLGEFLRMGKGEIANGGKERDSILCDLFEAIIGAIYIDGGLAPAKRFVLCALEEDIHSMRGLKWIADCKTHLQEQLQKTSQEPIEYYVINEEGPDHNKIFTVELAHSGKVLAQGRGKNKKEAEQEAARHAIEKYGLT